MNGEIYWKWAVRFLAVLGFLVLLTLLVSGREVDTAWIILIGGMMGLEPIINWQRKGVE